jgi:predicted nucleic acid-binding protein
MRFIDTNVFIYAATAHPKFGETSGTILKRVEDGERAATSTIVLCEVAWVMEAMGKQGKIRDLLGNILSFKNIEVLGFTEEDLLRGSSYMISKRLDFNDAVNLAIILREGITEIYSNDIKHLGRLEFPKLVFE